MEMIRNFSTPTSVLVITLSSRDLIKATSYLFFLLLFLTDGGVADFFWSSFIFIFEILVCFVYAFEAIYFTWNLNDADTSEFLHVEILVLFVSCNSRSKIAELQDQEKLLLQAREKGTPGSLCPRSSASHSGQEFQNFYYSLQPR
jgi:hypothetical protein